MSDSGVKCFAFDDHLVRVVMKGDDPWFVAMDVCRSIGIRNWKDAVERLDSDEKEVGNSDLLGGGQDVLIVSESGLYTIILRSHAAITPGTPAHRFRKWVTGVVLPQIRRTGAYAAPEADAAPRRSATSIAEDRNKLDQINYALRIYGPAAARWLWKELGLPWVPEMELATRERPAADSEAATFCQTRLERRPGVMTPAQTIYSAYRDWCSENGTVPISDSMFGKLMTRLGYDKMKSNRIYYRGLVLKPAEAAQDA